MTPPLIATLFVLYFALIATLSWWRSRQMKNGEYFKSEDNPHAALVTFGIIGDSMSGVTYLSVPGNVFTTQFDYLQVCLGYMIGYWIIAALFIPRYHQSGITSIYQWIGGRIGKFPQKIAALSFIVGRSVGASARLYLTGATAHALIFQHWGWSVPGSILAVISLIAVYTLRGGIKSLILTDAVQSAFMIAGVTAVIAGIATYARDQNISVQWVQSWLPFGDELAPTRQWGPFLKSVLSGAFITIAMTGLDQNIMQKTFSVKSSRSLQKYFVVLSLAVFIVHFWVMMGGSLLASVTSALQLTPIPADQRLTQAMLTATPMVAQILFLAGLAAATLNSADSVITTLTSSLHIDLFNNLHASRLSIRITHILVALALSGLAISLYFWISRAQNAGASTIAIVLQAAGWTYGPLVALFSTALLRKNQTQHSSKQTYVVALVAATILTLAIHAEVKLGVEVILVYSLSYFLFLNSRFILRRFLQKTN